jgi:hypothetical protein
MMKSVLVAVLLSLIAFPAAAQLLSDTPRCFTIINASGYKALGSVATAMAFDAAGNSNYHRDNFQLPDGARKEVCASGPFYDNYALEVQLRTLIPLWTCHVPTEGQDLRILSRTDEDGDVAMYLDCDPL